jgi:RNA polymerase sigma factor (sigma-70 family)
LTIAGQLQCTDLDDHFHQANVGADSAGPGSPGPLDVEALTREMVKGDEAAYRIFYEAYVHRLSRYLLVVSRGDEDAMREALQAALVRVVRYVKVFPDETRFWNWLTVLARTALADQRRKRSRYLAFLDRFTEHARVEAAVANDSDADTQLLALLERSLELLPPDERELVERKYFNNQPVREIAGALQASEKAVESRLTRVRRKLKDALLTALKHDQTN